MKKVYLTREKKSCDFTRVRINKKFRDRIMNSEPHRGSPFAPGVYAIKQRPRALKTCYVFSKLNSKSLKRMAILPPINMSSSNVTKEKLFCYMWPAFQVALFCLLQKNILYAGIKDRLQTFHMVASTVQIICFHLASNFLSLKLLQNYRLTTFEQS